MRNSCTLQSMADSFGVSTPFINSELARFISEGRIQAKIDRVGGERDDETQMNDTVETQAVTTLSRLYDEILTKGTILMNRVQTVAKTLDVWIVCANKHETLRYRNSNLLATLPPPLRLLLVVASFRHSVHSSSRVLATATRPRRHR